MVIVSVVFEEGEYQVVVVNTESKYARAFETYRPEHGPYGSSPGQMEEAKRQAVADAEDWVVKFRTAGIPAEYQVMS